MISAQIVGTMAVQFGRQSKQVLPMPTAPFLYKEIMRKASRNKELSITQINEAYTSICSFYDNEEIKYHKLNKYKIIFFYQKLICS